MVLYILFIFFIFLNRGLLGYFNILLVSLWHKFSLAGCSVHIRAFDRRPLPAEAHENLHRSQGQSDYRQSYRYGGNYSVGFIFPTGKRGVGVKSVDSSSSTTTSSVENSRKTADRVVPFHYEMVRIFSMLETVVTLVIPPVAIVIMNGVIIHGLTRHQLNQSFITGRNKHAPSLKNKTQLRHSRRVNIQVSIFTIFFCVFLTAEWPVSIV